MRFAFTDDQLAFRDAVRDLLGKECPPEVVRAGWPDGTDDHGARKGEGARADAARLDKVWTDVADMGVLGIGVSEANGGLGMGPLDWVLLAEETGYVALPQPFVETACVVAPLADRAGDPDNVLDALVAGERKATVAPLTGSVVAWADRADYLVSLDLRPDSQEWEARRIDGAESAPVDSLDAGRPLARLGDWGSDADQLASGEDAATAFDHGALATAAQLLGLGRRMLDLTVAYASERRQFGKPIGAQQAVKHHLADAAMGLRFAAPAVYGAAWSAATGAPTSTRDVSMAKAMASDAAHACGRHALQCHGAIGYTVEYDLHLYLKRAETLARAWGDAAWHRNRVALALGI